MPLDTGKKKTGWLKQAMGDTPEGPSAPTSPPPPLAAPAETALTEASGPPAAPASAESEPSRPPASEPTAPSAPVESPQPELAPKAATAAPAGKKSAKRAARKAAAAAPAGAAAPSTVPPVGAKQQERFQCRLTSVVSENVTRTEQAIAARSGLSLNAVREIAVWSVLGDPSNVDGFLTEILPQWLDARSQATMRAASEAA